ncbi:TRAP transporter small permease [Motiliproteus sp.]|uniref:TRAP transporter small permease n=1 Tax=Motiliproteus sp. TaxID=1898955 RepID=UPI003BABEC5E
MNNKTSAANSVGKTKIYDYDPEISSHPIPPHLHAIPDHAENRVDSFLIRFERVLDWSFRALMVLAALGLAALTFSQVIMRYVLESPFTGIEEASILLAVWVYFLGMGYATRQREHIHGGIVSLVVKSPYKVAIIRFVGTIICMLAACLFGYFACKYALKEIDKGRVSINLRWPRGIWSASMIAGFAMMVGYFLLEAVNEFRHLRDNKAQPEGKETPPAQSQSQLDSQEA